jgi:hypothetical protein
MQKWSHLVHTTRILAPSHIAPAFAQTGGRVGTPFLPRRSLYRPTLLRFSLGRHLLDYASSSANHAGLSRGSRCRPGFWETLTTSGRTRPQFLDTLTFIGNLEFQPLALLKRTHFSVFTLSVYRTIFVLQCYGALFVFSMLNN